jgi:hypothetical protein
MAVEIEWMNLIMNLDFDDLFENENEIKMN